MDKSLQNINSEYVKSLEMAIQLSQKEIETLRSIIRNDYQSDSQTTIETQLTELNVSSSILNSTNAEDLLNTLNMYYDEKVGIIELSIFTYDEKSLLNALSNEDIISEKFLTAVNYFQENGIVTWAVQLSNPTVISDPFVTEKQQLNYVLAPLRFKNKINGMLITLSNHSKRDLENSFILEVSNLSEIIAVAVENIISSRTLNNMNNKLFELSSRADLNSQLAGFGELAIKISEESLLPIKIIETNLELIRTGIDEKEKRFEIIRSQLDTLKSINTKLIKYFDAISKNAKERNKVNIKEVVQETLTLLDNSFQRYGIEYSVIESEDDISVLWNKIELGLTIFGIIIFALYNISEGGKLTISFSQINRKTASINISDNAEALIDLDNSTILEKRYRPKHIKHDLVSFYSISQYLTKNRSKIEFEPVEGSGNTFRLICPIA